MKACKLMVSRGDSDRAPYNATNLILQLRKHQAEHGEYSAATESNADLKEQTLLIGDAAVTSAVHTLQIMCVEQSAMCCRSVCLRDSESM